MRGIVEVLGRFFAGMKGLRTIYQRTQGEMCR